MSDEATPDAKRARIVRLIADLRAEVEGEEFNSQEFRDTVGADMIAEALIETGVRSVHQRHGELRARRVAEVILERVLGATIGKDIP